MDLQQFFNDTYVLEKPLAPDSIRQLRMTINIFGQWNGGEYQLSDLSDNLVNRWIVDMQTKWSPKTVYRRRAEILAIWRYAAECGLIAPPNRIRRVRIARVIPDAWTLEELRAILKSCENLPGRYRNGIERAGWWSCYSRLIYDTGLRPGDCRRLPFTLLEQKTFDWQQHKTGFFIRRTIRESTLEAVQRIKHPPREIVCEWLYCSRTYSYWWQKIIEGAGLTPNRRNGPQKLRRTSASHLERVHPGSAAAHLGHSNPAMAAKHYIDPTIAYGEPPLPPEV